MASAAANIIDMNRLNPVTWITPEILMPSAESIAKPESRHATVRAIADNTPGARGSEVNSNLLPPHRIGMRTDVRGSLTLASPRFGTIIAKIIPATMTSSGARAWYSSRERIMALPPKHSLRV